LHIAANDVMILNTSFRGLLRQELSTKCICATNNTGVNLNTTATTTPTTTTPNTNNNTGVRFNATIAKQVDKLVASDGAVDDYFGVAVAATDGMVVVGAHRDDDKGDSSGSVYLFEKNSTGQYEQVIKLVASDGAADDRFGIAVAATDGMVVVGAYLDDDKGDGSGSAYVFEKNSTGQYEQVIKLVASDGAADDRFGEPVAATNGMVVVVARLDDDKGYNSGSVYVFEKNSTGQFEQVSKLVASDGAASDQFGRAVAATDGMVVVGAYDDDKGDNSGSVYVFEKNSAGQYEQVTKLVASDGAANDYFGDAVAATDGTVVVGARHDDDKGDNSGSVYVFEKNNSTGQYEQVSKLVASDGSAADDFGLAVAATDGMVVVGARYDDDKGDNSGSVYVFEKNSAGQYEQVTKLVASDGAASDYFGDAVAATDGTVVVGANGDDDKGRSSGSVYVFE
jgi:methionine-rich copper-binding protein CopC